MAEFGEWVCGEVVKKIPYRHFVFSIPKILRRYFLYDRSHLSELSRCAWEALRAFFRETVPQRGAVPGAVIAIQTFGDFLGFHPHCHVLCTDGCFDEKDMFRVAPLNVSRPWVRMSQTRLNRWFVSTATTVTSPGEKGAS